MRLWIASMLFYSFVFLICQLLRLIVDNYAGKYLTKIQRSLVNEVIGTLQICTPMFDVGLILDNYGLFGVFVEISIIELANSYFEQSALAHPCPLITTVSKKRTVIRRALMVLGVQLIGAYLSYLLARSFWRLGVHRKHIELLQLDHCEADLTVALSTGALVEGFATFGSRAVEFYINEWYSQAESQVVVLNALFAGFLTAIGINYTGMYANPIVAWACTFNCNGVTHVGHLIVYWLSPIIGWYFAEAVFGERDCNLNYLLINDDVDTVERLKQQ